LLRQRCAVTRTEFLAHAAIKLPPDPPLRLAPMPEKTL
jgi:hypothetical protein